MHVELVRTNTSDGLFLHGAFHESQLQQASGVLVLCLHGVGGNFYSSRLFDTATRQLTLQGHQVLRVNTRGHDGQSTVGTLMGPRPLGAALEIVHDCLHDIRAWLTWAEKRGCQQVVLFGHSLGAIKSVYFSAHEDHPLLCGIVAASPPRLSYKAFQADEYSAPFFASMKDAQQLVAEKKGAEIMHVRVPVPMFISAATYVDKYGPEERYNIVDHIAAMQQPTLFTYGGSELEGGIAFAGLPDAIRAKVTTDQQIDVSVVPQANHIYQGLEDELGELVSAAVARFTGCG